jgi:deoxyribodipyrimidine photolyase-related protein
VPKDLILLLGDMMFPSHEDFPDNAPVFMREDIGLCTRVRHHQQKIVLYLSVMRHYAEDLGRRVIYQKLEDDGKSYLEALAEVCEKEGVERLHTYTPHDRYFRDDLRKHCEKNGIKLCEHPSPAFLTPEDAWNGWREGQSGRLAMASFYQHRRQQTGYLMTKDGKPIGEKYSFDPENREKLPEGHVPPEVPGVEPDEITREVIELVKEHFDDHPGNAEQFDWPVTRRQALARLNKFLDERLDLFGPYEDAIHTEQSTIYHSVLSPYLNNGLITPGEVVEKALDKHENDQVQLRSIEGYVRQIIGWREFIKRVDEEYGENGMDNKNLFGHQRKLNDHWYEGNTGLPPLDDSIKRVRDHGWAHHIERLMVIGNAMLLCEVQPEEAFNWFMEMFVDSTEWVMAPNVYGMSQHSDGGFFATKPYVGGSNYIRKMSNYDKGDWCDIWDGLYWRFIDRKRDYLKGNARMGQMVGTFDKMNKERKADILSKAEKFIHKVTNTG